MRVLSFGHDSRLWITETILLYLTLYLFFIPFHMTPEKALGILVLV